MEEPLRAEGLCRKIWKNPGERKTERSKTEVEKNIVELLREKKENRCYVSL